MTRKVVTALSILALVIVALFWASTYVNSLFGKRIFFVGTPEVGVEWSSEASWFVTLIDEDYQDGFIGFAHRGRCTVKHTRISRSLNLGRPFDFDLGPFAVRRRFIDHNDVWSQFDGRDRVHLTREQAQALPTIMAVLVIEFDIWLAFALVAAYPAARLIWWPIRRRRRRKRGLCPTCGYNLTGNTSGVCPECSRKIEDDKA